MKVALIFIKLFFISALLIISNGNLHLGDSEERGTFFELYKDWVGNVFFQGIEITGQIINTQWLPEKPSLG